MINIETIKSGKLINGDCLDELKRIPSNSIDMAAMDPPYGYSFMGKDWDKALPDTEIFKECLVPN
jgi:DNA modification methylase